jgi:hypothetical protein
MGPCDASARDEQITASRVTPSCAESPARRTDCRLTFSDYLSLFSARWDESAMRVEGYHSHRLAAPAVFPSDAGAALTASRRLNKRPVEKTDLECALQISDRCRDCGLRHRKPRCCPCHAAAFDDGGEDVQLMQFNAPSDARRYGSRGYGGFSHRCYLYLYRKIWIVFIAPLFIIATNFICAFRSL